MSEKTTHKVGMNVDALHLLEQIAKEEDAIPYGMRLGISLMHSLLQRCAGIASQIDNPELNIAMLRLHLYEVDDVWAEIEKQKRRRKEGAK